MPKTLTISKCVLISVTGLVLFLGLRTVILKSRVHYPSGDALKTNFPLTIAEGLSESIRFATISYDRSSNRELNHTAFQGLHDYIFNRYPKIFKQPPVWISHTKVANYSILIHVRGQNPKLKPYMLCAHLDVVPVDENLWTRPPFGGYMDEHFVWGRGALDDKNNAMAILEALNLRVERSEVPRRGFYVAFGHDEEVHGLAGAKAIAENLAADKVALEFIIDEGLVILKGAFPGVAAPIALLGVSEKGYLTVKVKCKDAARHASMPSHETAITTLARALTRFTSNAHPAHLTELQESLLREAAPLAKFPFDVIYLNLWLFGPVISYQMRKMDHVAAQMRTTSAVTVIRGGSKENVIPNEAEALVNHRILPGYSVDDVLKFDRHLVEDIPNVSVEIHGNDDVFSRTEPVSASSYDESSFGFKQIKRTTQEIYPEALVAPSLMVANTDTRHYFGANLTRNIYRYTPVMLSMADTRTVHGNDERISKTNYQRLADFFYQLTHNCDEDDSDSTTSGRFEL